MSKPETRGPVQFEEHRDGRIDVMLGAVAVATIVAVDYPPARGAFAIALPPWNGDVWEYATGVDAAKDAVAARVNNWLQAAGLRGRQ